MLRLIYLILLSASMYQYDRYDQHIIQERIAQFRGQTDRYLSGELKEEEFLPLRLQNGLYVQRLAPMLRVNVPYGMLNSSQLRRLAHIARHYDKGYCHVSTRQNIQFNWPDLAEVPDILAELAEVEMHATICLPAKKIQNRGHRFRPRSRSDSGTRYRPKNG